MLCEPSQAPPRAVVVALHGGGMRAGYFDGLVDQNLSLLALGADLGYTILAVDRPGYGLSAHQLPYGQTLMEQSETLCTALNDFALYHTVGAGFFLVAHSYGGKVALSVAADMETDVLLGLDISGCGNRYAADMHRFFDSSDREVWRMHWGALRFYPTNTFLWARSLLSPMPEREYREVPEWPDVLPGVAEQVEVPVRFTFAEYEFLWKHDRETLEGLKDLFGGERVVVDHQPNSGHNISLGWTARSYHLRALAFAEECIVTKGTYGEMGK
nr:alpha/beta hydrolase [Actinopolyspora biskrensis]